MEERQNEINAESPKLGGNILAGPETIKTSGARRGGQIEGVAPKQRRLQVCTIRVSPVTGQETVQVHTTAERRTIPVECQRNPEREES